MIHVAMQPANDHCMTRALVQHSHDVLLFELHLSTPFRKHATCSSAAILISSYTHVVYYGSSQQRV